MSKRPHPRTTTRDAGFTLPELVIAIVVTGIIVPVIAAAIVLTLKTTPSTTARADAGVAIQGIATWLPADVDSTAPGGMNANPAAVSGCQGTDPGRNVLRLTWQETFRGVRVDYVAAYRLVDRGTTAHIVRLSCSGSPTLGAPVVLSLSGMLAKTQPTVTLSDGDGDGLNDRVLLSVTTAAGPEVFIDAVTKNPNQPAPVPPPPTPTTATSSTTTTTSTTIANRPPVAQPVTLTANPATPVIVNLPASDPDGNALATTVTGVPAGWTVTSVGTQLTIVPQLPTGSKTFTYTVTDPSGLAASSTVTISVITSATTTTTTTPTTTTTTTTVPPPCVVSSMSVSPASVALTARGTGKLRRNVRVSISVASGYCVGLTLQYETGAPNGQYIQNFGTQAPYTVTLLGQPHGTELWSSGPHELVVRDGTGATLATRILTITD